MRRTCVRVAHVAHVAHVSVLGLQEGRRADYQLLYFALSFGKKSLAVECWYVFLKYILVT